MTIEAEHDLQTRQTPETDRFLQNLQQDSSEILGRKQELGLRVKDVLVARAHEFGTLGFFDRIPTTDFSYSGTSLDEDDEDSGELGLVVHSEADEDGYAKSGVVMTPDGVLLEGYANEGLNGGRFSFDFENAKEVPIEDYSKYFDEAAEVMKYITDEKTGVHAEEFRKEQAERLAEHIQEIKDDNQKYGVEGAEFTGGKKTVEKANEFIERITLMRDIVAQGERGITTGQLENLLGHVFAAQEYLDDYARGVDADAHGAKELVLMAGVLVSPKDAILGRWLHDLTADMWHNSPSQSSYLVRRANRVPYRNNQENEKIYAAMAVHKIKRCREGADPWSVPEFKQPPVEIVTERYGNVSLEEMIDWLLNKPVEEPRR